MTRNSMNCRQAFACLVALIVTTTSSLAAQQDQANRRLTDADVARLIPVLKAYVVELTRGKAAIETGMDVAREVMDEEGKIADPLAYMKAHGKKVLVPPAARYDLSCSRLASRKSGMPTAIFTLGVSGDKTFAAWQAFLKAPLQEGNHRRWEIAAKAEGIEAVVASALSFYKSKGVKSTRDNGFFGPIWFIGEEDGFMEYLNHWALQDVGSGSGSGCGATPTGPSLQFTYDLTNAVGAAAKKVYGESPLAGALAKAGMSREEYDEHFANLQDALRNANHPEDLNGLDEMYSRSEDAAEKARWRAHTAMARSNAEVFRRHAAELEPLVNAILRILYPPD